jgi:uncharacterized membrane protein
MASIIPSHPMPIWFRALKARPVMAIAVLLGVGLGLVLPDTLRPVTRVLWGWNAAVWFYLATTVGMMTRADHHRLRRNALVHAEGLATVTTVAALAATASLAAIMLELSQAKAAAPHGQAWAQVLFALGTILGSWLLLPLLFATAYASLYYDRADQPGRGLAFPKDEDNDPRPGYSDFLYFALTIAVASQTADVAITRTDLRRWVAVQSVLSFAFNTMLLALGVNIAAGLV